MYPTWPKSTTKWWRHWPRIKSRFKVWEGNARVTSSLSEILLSMSSILWKVIFYLFPWIILIICVFAKQNKCLSVNEWNLNLDSLSYSYKSFFYRFDQFSLFFFITLFWESSLKSFICLFLSFLTVLLIFRGLHWVFISSRKLDGCFTVFRHGTFVSRVSTLSIEHRTKRQRPNDVQVDVHRWNGTTFWKRQRAPRIGLDSIKIPTCKCFAQKPYLFPITYI